jgi:hypothetical protein
MEKKEQEKMKVGNRLVSVTKKGFPNKRELTKDERAIVDEITKDQKEEELDKIRRQIREALSKGKK